MVRRILTGATLAIALAALYFFHVRLRHRDLPFYRKLVQESADLHAHSALEKAPVRQIRKGVRKDIWTVKESGRVHGCIKSHHSDMILTQKKGKMQAVETLQGIEAWINSGEKIRHMTAESGICYFPSCRFTTQQLAADFEPAQCVAREAHLTKETIQFLGAFQIEHPTGRILGEKGTLLDKKGERRLFLEGGVLFEAAHAPFSLTSMKAAATLPPNTPLAELASQEIRFFDGVEIQTTSGLRALGGTALISQNSLLLIPEVGASCSLIRGQDQIDAAEIRADMAAHEILCLSPHGRLQETRTFFNADTGRAQFYNQQKGIQPQVLLLEGNVQIVSYLQEKESFAMADSASYLVKEQKIVLESAPQSRVYFKQQGLEASAPTVHIQEAIQGFGDVRFFFYPEEKTTIETIFSKYL